MRGVVQPDDFIPLLEETGLITEVGKWVLSEACAQGAAWRAAGYPIGMAVNVSGRQLDTDQLIADIEEALADSGLEPAALTIEITETTLMRNVEETARRLTAIKAARRADRDRRLRHRLLLARPPPAVPGRRAEDRPLVHLWAAAQPGGRDADPHARAARQGALDRDFAEGIEQQQELSLLRDEDCDSGQGFLFARPLDAAATEAFLQDWAATGSRPLLVQTPQHA